jgi:hypothetical protein
VDKRGADKARGGLVRYVCVLKRNLYAVGYFGNIPVPVHTFGNIYLLSF